MIHVYPNTKVYVPCPAGVVTGGAELLHQLVHILNKNGVEAYIIYFGNEPHSIPDDYKGYNVQIANSIEDLPRNIEVIYEGRFDLIRQNKNTQKLLWWLSVDHFYSCSTDFVSFIDIFKFNKRLGVTALLKQIRNLVLKNDKRIFHPITIKELKQSADLNCYQSEYAHFYLQKNGFKYIMPLKDYINDEHKFSSAIIQEKKDIILYNPKKGYKFTQKLISLAPDLHWIPLQGFSRADLIQVIRSAKLYIDFGYHPGKDRLPRECVTNGCCLITGMRGSASFFEDIPISNDYKFMESNDRIPKIISTIRYILANYNQVVDSYTLYRKLITQEKSEFENQIANIFGK